MKKKVVVLLTICFVLAFVQHFSKQNLELKNFINSTLANVESLAQDETGPNSWLQPDNQICSIHEWGVIRPGEMTVCVFCAVPYSCTAVGCR